MKYIILILSIFLVSCENSNQKETLSYTEETIDNCQYLIYKSTARSLTHKGNCNNPIHLKEKQ